MRDQRRGARAQAGTLRPRRLRRHPRACRRPRRPRVRRVRRAARWAFEPPTWGRARPHAHDRTQRRGAAARPQTRCSRYLDRTRLDEADVLRSIKQVLSKLPQQAWALPVRLFRPEVPPPGLTRSAKPRLWALVRRPRQALVKVVKVEPRRPPLPAEGERRGAAGRLPRPVEPPRAGRPVPTSE